MTSVLASVLLAPATMLLLNSMDTNHTLRLIWGRSAAWSVGDARGPIELVACCHQAAPELLSTERNVDYGTLR